MSNELENHGCEIEIDVEHFQKAVSMATVDENHVF